MHPNQQKAFSLLCYLLLISTLVACKEDIKEKGYLLEGTLKKWQPVTLTFEGPETSETDSINPFLDYSLLVNFNNGDENYKVPGYFAADGDAANTGAISGNKWQVRFSPNRTGIWNFDAYLLNGKNIAVTQFDIPPRSRDQWEVTGNFEVAAVDSTAGGLYGTGKLAYMGKHYLYESETGKAFLKNGVGSPENFLGYFEFDGTFDNGGAQTPSLNNGLHEYSAHVKDWNEGDPNWQNGKGKAIIGAVNYMASMGMNSLYFMSMNVHGDGDDVWPWTGPDEYTRFDISKLEQWEIVFRHMAGKGIALNVFTQETENDTLLNQGVLGLERKLYYKELIARFGHHPGIVWNLGEETNRTSEQLKSYASFIRGIDPYDHPIAVHNHIRVTGKSVEGRPMDPIKETLTPLLGYKNFEIPSLQMFDTTEVHREVLKWRKLSTENKRPWVVNVDEIGHWEIGVTADMAENNNHGMVMRTSLWGAYMGGAAGTSWYFGANDMPNNDLAAEDLRARENWWKISSNARQFFINHLPFDEMTNHDELLSNSRVYCFAKKGEIYAVYLPKNQTTELEIGDGNYAIAFYDPLEGGMLLDTPNQGWKITKANSVLLSSYGGAKNKDWVIVIIRKE